MSGVVLVTDRPEVRPIYLNTVAREYGLGLEEVCTIEEVQRSGKQMAVYSAGVPRVPRGKVSEKCRDIVPECATARFPAGRLEAQA